MLILSIVMFTAGHIGTLLLLQVTSATNTIVFSNVGNMFEVVFGVVFFGDKVFSNGFSIIGLFLNICSGLWYSIEAQPHALDCAIFPCLGRKAAKGAESRDYPFSAQGSVNSDFK